MVGFSSMAKKSRKKIIIIILRKNSTVFISIQEKKSTYIGEARQTTLVKISLEYARYTTHQLQSSRFTCNSITT